MAIDDCRDPSKPVYQRRISSVSRLLTAQWSSLIDPPGILVGADDGVLVYEASMHSMTFASTVDPCCGTILRRFEFMLLM